MKVKFNYTVYFAKPSWSYRRVDTHNRRGAIDRHTTPNMMHHDTWNDPVSTWTPLWKRNNHNIDKDTVQKKKKVTLISFIRIIKLHSILIEIRDKLFVSKDMSRIKKRKETCSLTNLFNFFLTNLS